MRLILDLLLLFAGTFHAALSVSISWCKACIYAWAARALHHRGCSPVPHRHTQNSKVDMDFLLGIRAFSLDKVLEQALQDERHFFSDAGAWAAGWMTGW